MHSSHSAPLLVVSSVDPNYIRLLNVTTALLLVDLRGRAGCDAALG